MKCIIEFFNIPQEDFKYINEALDDIEYQRVLEDMVTELRDGNYTVDECE